MSDAVELGWAGWPTPAELEAALRSLTAGPSPVPRRVEVSLDADAPRSVRHVLHARGFRLEGVARQGRVGADGRPRDVLRYARLAADPVTGREASTAVMNSVMARKRVIAHALITDAAGRVLLCETSFKPDFELPGGIVEPEESPAAGCVREMREEMGADLGVGPLLVVDWLPPYLGWEDAVELIFDGGELDAAAAAALRPDGREIVGLPWLEPAAGASRMTERAGRHLLAALEARAAGRAVYLEAGLPLS